ncbi:glycosyltransferase [Pedobacter sp. SD-b]|uniref:Glycosyltransferase n=1 Tax=Pedobacter segetis TaxID=2793069 RepID=A0ABS1BGU3_9SPHI|nr:glycosyltransferase [Pedobacter segetis]MBK0382067.1 glycosyltransferase [Pedobacter segetis]
MSNISIIIPTFNRKELLLKCLKALQLNNQEVLSIEYDVIVSDDSLNNNAKELIENNFSWVKWIEGPKKGPASNRNFAVKQSKGKWIIFLDDDCIPQKKWLQSYTKAIEENKAEIFEGYTFAEREKMRFDEEAPINLAGGNLWTCNFAINKNTFLSFKGFNESFPYAAMEDIEFHTRIKKDNKKIIFLEDAKVIHPWRRVLPFSTFKKQFFSHQYYKRHFNYNSTQFRINRIKIFLGCIPEMTKALIRFRFKGTAFYFEKIILNFALIFA